MNFLKNLFGSAGRPSDSGLYYYVRCNRCGEVIRVRINSMNDLSRNEDETALFARKVIVGQNKCFNRIDAEFTYDLNHRLTGSEISGGTIATKADYEAYQQQLLADPPNA